MNVRAGVSVVDRAADAVPLLLEELRWALDRRRRPLIGFATGSTFTAFLQALARELEAGRLGADSFVATHLDEYEGFAPQQAGGMVHELFAACPPFRAMHERGAFVPVPHAADPAALAAHERRLAELGGVSLQFAGIGRNGHVAFHEPGVPFDRGFHVADLAATTRDDARARFAPREVPRRAITSGTATILRAERVVLSAFGAPKAAAIGAMRNGPPSLACPASALCGHPALRIVVDRAAAANLELVA